MGKIRENQWVSSPKSFKKAIWGYFETAKYFVMLVCKTLFKSASHEKSWILTWKLLRTARGSFWDCTNLGTLEGVWCFPTKN